MEGFFVEISSLLFKLILSSQLIKGCLNNLYTFDLSTGFFLFKIHIIFQNYKEKYLKQQSKNFIASLDIPSGYFGGC